MDRRTFFGGAVAGVGGLIFPRISESKPISSDEFVLKGITKEGMLRKIANFPQSAESTLFYSCWQDCGYPEPPPTLIICQKAFTYPPPQVLKSWRVEGDSILVNSVQRSHNEINIRHVDEISFYRASACETVSKCESRYKRFIKKNVLGWIPVER